MTMKFNLCRHAVSIQIHSIFYNETYFDISLKIPKILIFLVNNDIGHLLETSWEYFGPNKLRKVIDNTFIILSYKFYKFHNSVGRVHCGVTFKA